MPRCTCLKRRKTYETRLSCRYISLFPYYLSVLSCKLEALMFTTFILTTVQRSEWLPTTTCYMKQSKASTFVNLSIPLFVQNYLNVIYNLRFTFWSDLTVSVMYSGLSSPASGLGWIWLGTALWSLLSLCLSSPKFQM